MCIRSFSTYYAPEMSLEVANPREGRQLQPTTTTILQIQIVVKFKHKIKLLSGPPAN